MDNLNFNANSTPPTAPKKRFGSVVWILLVFILAVAAVLIFLTLHGKKNTQQPPSLNQNQVNSTDNLQSEQTIMLGQSKIKVPVITKAQVISSSTSPSDGLPAEISHLIHGGVEDLSVEKITYGSQGTGYRIKYGIAVSDMEPFYYSFDTNPLTNYKLLLSLRNQYFSLLELQTKTYNIRISLSMVQNNLGQVLIIAVPL